MLDYNIKLQLASVGRSFWGFFGEGGVSALKLVPKGLILYALYVYLIKCDYLIKTLARKTYAFNFIIIWTALISASEHLLHFTWQHQLVFIIESCKGRHIREKYAFYNLYNWDYIRIYFSRLDYWARYFLKWQNNCKCSSWWKITGWNSKGSSTYIKKVIWQFHLTYHWNAASWNTTQACFNAMPIPITSEWPFYGIKTDVEKKNCIMSSVSQ